KDSKRRSFPLFDGVGFDLVRAAGRVAHRQNIAILGFTTKQERNTGSLTAYRGQPLIFQRNIPEGGIRTGGPGSESKSPLRVSETQSAFHSRAQRNAFRQSVRQ